MSEREWFDAQRAIPPEGAEVELRWADGATCLGRRRDNDGYLEWHVPKGFEDREPPSEWRATDSTTRDSYFHMAAGSSWIMLMAIVAAVPVIFMGSIPGVLIMLGGGLVIWQVATMGGVAVDGQKGCTSSFLVMLLIVAAIAFAIMSIFGGSLAHVAGSLQ